MATAEAGWSSCGVISTRVHSRRPQRLRDIPVARQAEVVWAKRRFFCDEYLCPRQTFTQETTQVPRRARSTRRLRDALVAAVIGSGRAAAAEAALSFGLSWWLVQRALDSAALTLPDVDALAGSSWLMGNCVRVVEDKRARGPAGMSVSKHSTWNRTTSRDRAYRGRSRCCHHPF
ncbi:transposase family protein [Pseudarthrobacter sp. C1]|uniref:transposase family protein n=1 Tax=Pseudarthrobacter sp. C1 TaxID=3108940 RepID=UPI003A4C7D10